MLSIYGLNEGWCGSAFDGLGLFSTDARSLPVT